MRRSRRTDWPEWWEWELELTSHVLKRMVDRGFSEADLRSMMASAVGLRADDGTARWVVQTSHHSQPWEVIVELDPDAHLLVVITRYCVSFGVAMKHTYLEVTYRKGQPLAAYYYLPRRDGDKSARTQRVDGGLLVDFSSDGRPIGVEISSPSRLDMRTLNEVLVSLGQEPVRAEDLAPLLAA